MLVGEFLSLAFVRFSSVWNSGTSDQHVQKGSSTVGLGPDVVGGEREVMASLHPVRCPFSLSSSSSSFSSFVSRSLQFLHPRSTFSTKKHHSFTCNASWQEVRTIYSLSQLSFFSCPFNKITCSNCIEACRSFTILRDSFHRRQSYS